MLMLFGSQRNKIHILGTSLRHSLMWAFRAMTAFILMFPLIVIIKHTNEKKSTTEHPNASDTLALTINKVNFADIKAADIGGDAADAITSMSAEETQNDLKNDVEGAERHSLPPTENKNISIDEMAEFEVRFKNAQMTLKFSKAEEACSEHTKLLIIIPLMEDAFDTRNMIRNTWASNLPNNVRVYFLTGTMERNESREELDGRLQEERRTFADVIKCDLVDVYANLSIKTYAIFAWKEMFCKKADFLMKNDDDAVVIIDRLLYWMRRYFELPSVGDDRVVWTNESLQQMVAATPSTPTKKLIFGIRLHNKKVVREKTWKKYKKWVVPKEDYAPDTYPNFINGPSYLLTAEAASAILEKTPEVSRISIEDALFTGILAELADVRRVNAFSYIRTYGWIYDDEPCDEGEGSMAVPKLCVIHLMGRTDKIEDANNYLRQMKCKNKTKHLGANNHHMLFGIKANW